MQKEDKDYKPIKFDSKKTRMELLPPDALISVAQVLTHGAEKYADRNWEKGEGIIWERYIGALLRHMMLFMMGEDTDPDSGLPILAHMSCDALFLLASYLRKIGEDTRWKLPKEFVDDIRKCVDDFNTKWEKENVT